MIPRKSSKYGESRVVHGSELRVCVVLSVEHQSGPDEYRLSSAVWVSTWANNLLEAFRGRRNAPPPYGPDPMRGARHKTSPTVSVATIA